MVDMPQEIRRSRELDRVGWMVGDGESITTLGCRLYGCRSTPASVANLVLQPCHLDIGRHATDESR